MKQYLVIIAVFAVLLFMTPLLFGGGAIAEESGGTRDSHSPTEPPAFEFPPRVSVLLSESGEVLDLSIEEYLVGCLFAQIPVNYHTQALKAQAIAAHTYLLRLILDGNVISDNPATCQPYFDESRARALFADDVSYTVQLERVREAARYGATRAIFHRGQPIYAVYHSLSAGVTNTAFSVWGADFPYLRSVDSSWDREHRDFICTNEVSAESVRLAMFRFNRTATMPLDFDEWFTDELVNEFGYVISASVGGNRLSGGDMWRVFGMRSTAFTITRRTDIGGDGIFIIESRGFGHGVGMSQHGADVLGRRGFDYAAILNHYFTGVEIVTVGS